TWMQRNELDAKHDSHCWERWIPGSLAMRKIGVRQFCRGLAHRNDEGWSCAPNDEKSTIHLQGSDEGLLRDVDLAELPHLLLAFLLLLQKFSFTGDVAAVALRGDVLAQRAHGLARDHLAADRRLDRNLEHVRRDQLLHLLDHGAAAPFGAGAM